MSTPSKCSILLHQLKRIGFLKTNKTIFWGCTGILANVQGKIGAPYRDLTQIGWQVWIPMGIYVNSHRNPVGMGWELKFLSHGLISHHHIYIFCNYTVSKLPKLRNVPVNVLHMG